MDDMKLRAAGASALNHAIAVAPDLVPSTSHVLIALETDSVADVLRRAMTVPHPPVEVAVYWPDREPEANLDLLLIGPATGDPSTIDVPASKSSIGMVCDYMRALRLPLVTFTTTAGATALQHLREPTPA